MRWLPPKSPLDLTKETRVEGGRTLGEGGAESEKWPQRACTTMFSLIPKNVTREKPIALMPTLIRWWEALKASEVVKWKQKDRIDWDATDCRNGWKWRGSHIEREKKIWEWWPWSLLVDWAWATHFSFTRKI